MITLEVNGKQVQLERPTPLLDYIASLGVDHRAIAVEHNGQILERSAYATITLDQDDRVEIVRMVGGGSPRASGRGSARGFRRRSQSSGARSRGQGHRTPRRR